MKTCIILGLLLSVSLGTSFPQTLANYEIYAIEYAVFRYPGSDFDISIDSVSASFYIWYLNGSKHSFENMYLLVNGDADAYVRQLKRMKELVPNRGLIIPGHDPGVLSIFPKVAEGVVKIR